MPVLKRMVTCCNCTEMVDQAKARLLNPLEREKRFECYECFKSAKNRGPLAKDAKLPEKKDYFCPFCKYKFRSAKATCPYCGRSERVIERNVTVVDLLA